MHPVTAAVDPVLATLLLSCLVLAAGVGLAAVALVMKQLDAEARRGVFALVGVLFGLLAAGGLGSLFAKQAAETSADQAAEQSAQDAAGQVKEDVASQVDRAIEQTQP